jgi:hypothetical protein
MADEYGVLATQLTNDELERQGVQAHATRHWAFLHGTGLEAHQIARSVAPNARLVASMYKHDPPLLRADGDQRVITDADRAWLSERGSR